MTERGTATPLERRNVGILAANQALSLVITITVMTLSGLVGQRLAPAEVLATLPIAMMMTGVLAASVPSSLLMNRIGRRGGFLVGSLLGAAGGVVSVVAIGARSFALFCLGNLLIGVYKSFANYYRFAAADAAGPGFRSRAISMVMAGGVVAAFLGPFNASRAVDLLPSVPQGGPYAVVVVLAFLGGWSLLGLRIPDEEATRTGSQRSLAQIRAEPAFLVAVLAATVSYATMNLMMTAMPLAMQASGFDLGHSATVMQWHVLGMFAPSFVTGRLIARWGSSAVLLAGAGVLALSLVAGIAGRSLVHYLVALLLLGIGWNLLYIAGSALLSTVHTPAERGKVQGINEFIVSGAVVVSSLLAGALLETLGWTTLSLIPLPFVLLTALATWRWRRLTPSPSPTSTAS